uniref:Uncharacterized protein n=1 Tax=Coccidioides posadasii RMSCC 3488 TaxID=454284 RepID=A0A0J6IBJ1_COCPO|nr:hypothetical protein CPAG_05340 [Coccidioides posadasii RMSCC 3488]
MISPPNPSRCASSIPPIYNYTLTSDSVQQLAMKVVYGKKWIGDQFDGHGFEFPDGSTWEIKEKISEEALLFPDRHKEDLRSDKGKDAGKDAIMKIRMQIPPDPDIADPNSEKRESIARNEAGLWSRRELSSLEYLTDRGCSVTPKLLAWAGCSANGAPMGPQRLYPYHRHGEGHRRIFGNLPGSSIQAAGKDSRCFPPLVEHLIYDPKKNRCYIIDYEDVNFLQLANPLRRAREEFCKWSLTGRDRQK